MLPPLSFQCVKLKNTPIGPIEGAIFTSGCGFFFLTSVACGVGSGAVVAHTLVVFKWAADREEGNMVYLALICPMSTWSKKNS
jgi:hypothetical protein